MKIKPASLAALASVALVAPSLRAAAPLYQYDDYFTVQSVTETGMLWQSNIFYSSQDEQSAFKFYTIPGLDLLLGNPAISSLFTEVKLRYEMTAWSDGFNELNSQLPSARLDGRYGKPGADPLWFKYGAGAAKKVQSTDDPTEMIPGVNRTLTERYVYDTNLDAVWDFSPKAGIGTGIRWNQTIYVGDAAKDKGSRNSDTFSIPVDFYYIRSEKLRYSVGYRYGETDVHGSALNDSKDHFFNVGAQGQLTPKLDADLRAGVTYRETANADSSTGFTSNGTLKWHVTTKTDVILALDSGFSTSAYGDSVRCLGGALTLKHNFNERFEASLTGGYRNLDYTASKREEDTYTVMVEGRYAIDKFWGLSMGAGYFKDSSEISAYSFDNKSIWTCVTFTY